MVLATNGEAQTSVLLQVTVVSNQSNSILLSIDSTTMASCSIQFCSIQKEIIAF